MKKSINSVKKTKPKKTVEAGRIFAARQTWIFFGLMAVLYLFSLFGGMFATSTFTYAEF